MIWFFLPKLSTFTESLYWSRSSARSPGGHRDEWHRPCSRADSLWGGFSEGPGGLWGLLMSSFLLCIGLPEDSQVIWFGAHPTSSFPVLNSSFSLLPKSPHLRPEPAVLMDCSAVRFSACLCFGLTCLSSLWAALRVLAEHRVLTLLSLRVCRLEPLSLPVTLEAATLWGWRGQEQLRASPLGALSGT